VIIVEMMVLYEKIKTVPKEILKWYEFCNGKQDTIKFIKDLEARKFDASNNRNEKLTHLNMIKNVKNAYLDVFVRYKILAEMQVSRS
jgi:hypothetical protein